MLAPVEDRAITAVIVAGAAFIFVCGLAVGLCIGFVIGGGL